MTISILGLGTASPANTARQADVLAMSEELICTDERQRRLLRVLFKKSGVSNRHSCVPYQTAFDWQRNSGDAGPTTGERVQLYAEHAGPLARQAALRALDDAHLSAAQITHLVTVSCTGFDAPGVDVELISSLGLSRTTQRVHVGFMGCHGAINGLRAARGLVAANPGARVLLCAVELCSLHYRLTWDTEGIKGNALFADGAAAVVIGDTETGNAETTVAPWSVIDTASCLIPDSLDAMTWRIGDHGFEMTLTGDVPRLIEEHLEEFLVSWLSQHDLKIEDIAHWVVHPGGPRIIDAVRTGLRLPAEAMTLSREILHDYGNMSSPTILFILERLRGQSTHFDGPTLVLGFGPGLMAEAALLTGHLPTEPI